MKSEDTHSIIFSQASEGGALRLDTPVGQTLDLFSQEALPASPSASRANDLAQKTSDTLRPLGSRWSRPSGLLASLASKLQQQLTKTTGSMIYSMRWKEKATPQGRLYFQLAASGRRTFGNDCGLWAGWPTPATRDHKDTGNLDRSRWRKDGKERNDTVPRQAALAGWPSPTAQDHSRGVKPPIDHDTGIPLTQRVAQIKMDQPARIKPDGTILTGFSAEMENGGQLNPAHSRWLMGYPPEWDDCALTAMPSSRKSRQK
jgi:hypothetical protein